MEISLIKSEKISPNINTAASNVLTNSEFKLQNAKQISETENDGSASNCSSSMDIKRESEFDNDLDDYSHLNSEIDVYDVKAECVDGDLGTNKKRKRSVWTKQIFLDRRTQGEYHILMPQLKLDEEKFRQYFKMSSLCFNYILNRIAPLCTVKQTHFRQCIALEERLTLALRFLITGDDLRTASQKFRISHHHISRIVSDILSYICIVFESIYMRDPTENEWLEMAQEFEDKFEFPNCVGIQAALYIKTNTPMQRFCGNNRKNKNFNAFAMTTLVDAWHNFLKAEVHEIKVNKEIYPLRKFKNLIDESTLPGDCTTLDNEQEMPYVILADAAFQLTDNVLKPYPKRNLDDKKKIFNYRLNHARKVVKSSVAMLTSRFAFFQNPIFIMPDKIAVMLKAACILHNIIRDFDNLIESDCKTDDGQMTGVFHNLHDVITLKGSNGSTKQARTIRDTFADYFMEEGAVEWQNECLVEIEKPPLRILT